MDSRNRYELWKKSLQLSIFLSIYIYIPRNYILHKCNANYTIDRSILQQFLSTYLFYPPIAILNFTIPIVSEVIEAGKIKDS